MIRELLLTALACGAVLIAFALARRVNWLSRHHPLANTTLIAASLLLGLLALIDQSPTDFGALVWPVRAMLPVAIVALGAVLARHARALRANAWPIGLAIVSGSVTGIVTAVLLARAFGLPEMLVKALSTKSVTSPFAIALMQSLGGPPALAAGMVILTGVLGAIIVPPLLDRMKCNDSETLGLAMGMSSHIAGTDALTRRDVKAAAFSATAMVLAGLVTSLLLPLLWPLLF